VATALAKIADAVIRDQRCILTVSTPASDVAGVRDVSVSLPRVVGGKGVLATFHCGLDEREQEALEGSAQVVRQAIDELDV
jgi:L-lactate dehydrogenase